MNEYLKLAIGSIELVMMLGVFIIICFILFAKALKLADDYENKIIDIDTKNLTNLDEDV